MKGEIFVVCTDSGQYDREHILQLLSRGCMLAAESGGSVTAVCIGSEKEKQFNALMEYGAGKILFHECLEPVPACWIREIAAAMIEQKKPEVVLFPSTEAGKRLAAVLSTRFEAGLTADCIDIGKEPEGEYYFSRAAMNDSVIAKIQCINSPIKMGTVKEGAFVKQKCMVRQERFIEKFVKSQESESRESTVRVLKYMVHKEQNPVDIGKAPVVFCIGRGVRQSGMYERICRLAELCGAEITATRAAVEELSINKKRQVGQSGKSISPKLYVSFGVSGASQHMVGIKNAGIVLAVNHDPNAPIFSYADYAIVEEIEAVVREMEVLMAAAA